MPLFEKLFDKPRTPGEVVPKAVAAFQQLEAANKDKELDRALDSITRYVAILKIFLFGDEEHDITKEAAFATAVEVTRTDLMSRMVKHQYQLDFETRKDVAQVFGAVVRLKDGEGRCPGAQYVRSHFGIVEQLFQGYEDSMYALNCGSMIRDCIRDEQLAKSILDSSLFMRLFEKVEMPNFEIASDAFSTFKDLLTRHKAAVVAAYLQEHYTEFFAAYMKLLQSPNYVTRRQSLKLLGELLLDRSNVKVMVKFVSDVTHLMQMMVLLKDQSRSIQFEAFHVFKVFVANPNKPQPVVDILTNNRDKLLKYLEEFHTDKDDDEQFKEEKAVIIKEISLLGQPPSS